MALGIAEFLIDKVPDISLIPLAVILYLKDRGTFDINPNAFNFAKILVVLFRNLISLTDASGHINFLIDAFVKPLIYNSFK